MTPTGFGGIICHGGNGDMNIKKLKTYVRTVSQRYRQQKSVPAQTKFGPGSSGEGIIGAIINRVAEKNTNCSSWRIGLTHEPAQCKACWEKTENVDDWTQWQAVSLSDALYIEKYFIFDKEMESVTDEALSPDKAVFIYIF
jgi:hypothetical protein